VLIYERIREEVRGGRTAIAAIDAGFTRALATIWTQHHHLHRGRRAVFIGTGAVRNCGDARHRHPDDAVLRVRHDRLIVAYWVRMIRPPPI
jgi:preprotein translocase subunit SecD